jgi:hypothetical protein
MIKVRKDKIRCEKDMLDWMTHKQYKSIKCTLGTIEVKFTESKIPMTKPYLVQSLKEHAKMDEGNATQLVSQIFDSRPISNKRRLVVSGGNSKRRKAAHKEEDDDDDDDDDE